MLVFIILSCSYVVCISQSSLLPIISVALLLLLPLLLLCCCCCCYCSCCCYCYCSCCYCYCCYCRWYIAMGYNRRIYVDSWLGCYRHRTRPRSFSSLSSMVVAIFFIVVIEFFLRFISSIIYDVELLCCLNQCIQVQSKSKNYLQQCNLSLFLFHISYKP